MLAFWILFTVIMVGGLIFSLRMQKKIKARIEKEAKDDLPKSED